MQTGPNGHDNPLFESVNRQLLQNQSFLYEENQKLQKHVDKLSKQLNQVKTTTVNPELYESLKREKNNLLELNQTLKSKIKILKSPPAVNTQMDMQKDYREKHDLMKTVQDLDEILQKVKNVDKPPIKEPDENFGLVVEILRKKLDESEQQREELNETVRKLRSDDEKYMLRERISDMKQLITDLEVENCKLKYESEQLSEDIETYKKQLHDATEEAKVATKKTYQLEEEKDNLKDRISELENEKIRLKKEMIEEMNEANRAKRVSVDTEIALQHISEAYENKRTEVMALTQQLEEAEKIIKGFRKQFHLEY